MIRGIVWDFDGTIVDTETPQFEAWDILYQEYGVRLDPAVWGKMVGTSTEWDLFDVLEGLVGEVDRFRVDLRVRALVAERMDQAPLRPGVAALIREAGESEIRQAIASSSPRWWIHQFVVRHQLDAWLTTIASADDVLVVKPDPTVYRVALAGIQVLPAEAVAIEDSPHGSAAALAAGLRCVVVPNPSTVNLTFPAGVVRRDTLEHLSLKDLVILV